MKQYEVYHSLMRDAQVFCKDSGVCNVKEGDGWRDFSLDPLLDVVTAEDEIEAVKMVSEETGCHKNNLYAAEHVVDATGTIEFPDGTHPFRMIAGRFDEEKLTGIEITLPDSRTVRVSVDRTNGDLAVTVSDAEGSNNTKKTVFYLGK